MEDLKARLAISILYATGLHLDELCHLKYKDTVSFSKNIHVADSKNCQDRFVPMPDLICQMILFYYLGLPKNLKLIKGIPTLVKRGALAHQ